MGMSARFKRIRAGRGNRVAHSFGRSCRIPLPSAAPKKGRREPFFRADPARRQDIRGAGLGLTIAREIIHRAGGTISISNRAEGGLRQVVELPQAEAQM
jgi:signal transduction histidine kinase